MHKQRVSIFASSILGIVSVFFPFLKASLFTLSLMQIKDRTTAAVFIFFLIPFIISILGDRKTYLKTVWAATAMISASIPVVMLILWIKTMRSQQFNLVSFDTGFFLVAVVSLILISNTVLFSKTRKEEEEEAKPLNETEQLKENQTSFSNIALLALSIPIINVLWKINYKLFMKAFEKEGLYEMVDSGAYRFSCILFTSLTYLIPILIATNLKNKTIKAIIICVCIIILSLELMSNIHNSINWNNYWYNPQ